MVFLVDILVSVCIPQTIGQRRKRRTSVDENKIKGNATDCENNYMSRSAINCMTGHNWKCHFFLDNMARPYISMLDFIDSHIHCRGVNYSIEQGECAGSNQPSSSETRSHRYICSESKINNKTEKESTSDDDVLSNALSTELIHEQSKPCRPTEDYLYTGTEWKISEHANKRIQYL